MKKVINLFCLIFAILAAAGCVVNPAVLNASAPVADTATKAADATEPVPAEDNLLFNPGFEDGVEGWYPFGTCKIKEAADIVHLGDRSAYVHFRLENWHGIAVK